MKRTVQRVLIAAIAVSAGALGSVSVATASAHQAGRDAHVTIVHGVRGLVANVHLDGKSVLTNFAPRRSVGPLAIPPGRHHLLVTTSAAGTPVLSETVTLTAGEHVTAALGLDAAGQPHLYLYPDTLRQAASSPATLVMRDVAAASNLRAMVDGKDDGSLGDGGQLVHAVSVGKHMVSLVNPTTGKIALAPQRVPVTAGAATALYLIGSASKQDLAWVATRVVPADAAPVAVHTGNSGLAAPSGPPWGGVALAVSGLLGLGLALGGRRRRRTALDPARGE
jgi:hypothetical protein